MTTNEYMKEMDDIKSPWWDFFGVFVLAQLLGIIAFILIDILGEMRKKKKL